MRRSTLTQSRYAPSKKEESEEEIISEEEEDAEMNSGDAEVDSEEEVEIEDDEEGEEAEEEEFDPDESEEEQEVVKKIEKAEKKDMKTKGVIVKDKKEASAFEEWVPKNSDFSKLTPKMREILEENEKEYNAIMQQLYSMKPKTAPKTAPTSAKQILKKKPVKKQ